MGVSKGRVDEPATEEAVPLRSLMRKALAPRVERPVELPTLAPLVVVKPKHPPRDAGLPAVSELPKGPKLIVVCGPGGAGKTTTVRALVSDMAEARTLRSALIAAADTGVVALSSFLPKDSVNQPASGSDEDQGKFMRALFAELESEEPPPVTILDCGGGNTSFMAYLEANPGALAKLEARGVAVVMMWFFTPRVSDLALLKAFRDRGFRATATVLAMSLVRDWQLYEPLRAQPIYQEVLREGAAELWIPLLEPNVALEVERKGFAFHHARDGRVPPGRDQDEAVDGDASLAVAGWMEEFRQERAPIETWLK